MLPSSLLITRRWRDTIRPVYAQLNEENLEVARLLIQTYRNHVGKKKGELNETVDALEDLGHDYRYVRGLSALLSRRCQLEIKAAIGPVKARREVFKRAHEFGLPTTQDKRQVVLYQAAFELGVTVEDLEKSLYGDLEDEFIMKGFEPVNPEALVKQYNLSLTQTLLFYSTEFTFTSLGNWQRIFRQIKWLGLIYTIWKSAGKYEVRVDGPASLFKLNRRYGTSLAKLLPTIIESGGWTVKAKVLLRTGERRLLNLELDNRKHGRYMEALYKPEEKVYDSKVEQDFASRFNAMGTGWTLIREPEPIPVGRQVMIPDFGFQKGGLTAYLEVVGFWTPQYIKEKVKKLGLLGDVDMIVAADQDLACQKLDKIGKKLNVIYYHRKIPLKPILAHLKAKEKQLVKRQIEHVRVESLILQKPVVVVKELAEKLGFLEETVKEALKEKTVLGYTRLGDMLIKDIKLKEIKEILESRLDKEELNLFEASKIIEDVGGRKTTSILEALGYKVEWHGIDFKLAKIRRKSETKKTPQESRVREC